MQIKFSSKFIKITFDDKEIFPGKSVRMKGEPLSNGFDAVLNTAEWLENHIGYALSPDELNDVKKAIEQNNLTDSFKILFVGE